MLLFSLNRNADTSLIRQVYQQIRTQILHGDLKAGEKLPPTRELAADLNVSRIVIVEAYELLIAEGFLEGIAGSGTYVSPGACLTQHSPRPPLISNNSPETGTAMIDFRSGVPAVDCFPRKKWAALTHRVCLEAPDSLLSYDYPEGRYELRESIGNYLKKNRGVDCSPEQIVITSGSVQGLVLAAQALLSPGKTAIIEEPANKDIRKIFSASGASILPIDVDDSGIRTELLPETKIASVLLVTPSHQFPLGGNLPIQRRIELVEFARSTGSFIIEDDYDSEYRYEGPPVSSLQGLDPEHVIYLGTFSKILFPALRLGYMILPPDLVAIFRGLKRLSDMHSNSLNQLTLARFIQEGHLERHICRMKKIYRKRRDALTSALSACFRQQINLKGLTTGLHLIAEFRNIEFTGEVTGLVRKAGVKIYPVGAHAIRQGGHTRELIFGYGHLTEEIITDGIKRLKGVLNC